MIKKYNPNDKNNQKNIGNKTISENINTKINTENTIKNKTNSENNNNNILCENRGEVNNKSDNKSGKSRTANNQVDLYVGTRLKIRRSELALSQNKIGEMTGVTFQQIQKYEKGQNRIGSSRLYEFAKILKVPVSYFFENYEATINGIKEALSENSTKLKNKVNGNNNNINNSNNNNNDNNNTKNKDNEILEKEIVGLVKNFSQIKDKIFRKSIFVMVKNALGAIDKSKTEEEDKND